MKKRIKNIFISHTHDDSEVVQNFVEVLNEKRRNIFYSSDPKKGIKAGQGVNATLDEQLRTADLFIPIVTEKYIRSIYCLYELSVACFMKSIKGDKFQISPLCTTEKVYRNLSNLLERFNVKYICRYSDKGLNRKCVEETRTSFGDLLISNKDEVKTKLTEFWKNFPKCDENKQAYIGGVEDFTNILKYCYSNNIKRLTSSYCDESLLKQKISQAEEITIVSTTGDSLIKTLKESFVRALSHGCTINIALPNQYSPFINDVAESEMADAPNDKQSHLIRLAQEFSNIFGYLKEAYTLAKSKVAGDKTRKLKLGKVTMYCAHNCFRQTVTMARKGETYWVWCTFTMPPARAIDGTPSMMVEGKKINDEAPDGEKGSVLVALTKHCETVIKVAKNKNAYIEINEKTELRPFFLENESAKKYWKDKIEIAKENMDRQLENPEAVLIEVAAQHPLWHGIKPNVEFRKRLDEAIYIYKKCKKDKVKNIKICVPGSIHQHNGIKDKISLSRAGINYLVEHKIPKKDLIGEDVLSNYKKDGMYNSADECYAISKLFFDKDYTRLICVCGPNQAQRKTLFYVEFGIIPMCYCVSVKKMYHSIIDELFVNLPNVIYKDHDWQNENSEAYINSRKKRKP